MAKKANVVSNAIVDSSTLHFPMKSKTRRGPSEDMWSSLAATKPGQALIVDKDNTAIFGAAFKALRFFGHTFIRREMADGRIAIIREK